MNRRFLVLISALFFSTLSYAQVIKPGDNIPNGAVVYSLPRTVLGINVIADHESFVAGPYAKYAEKYLGNKARMESGDFYSINSIELIPFVEADPSFNMAINVGNSKNAQANFLGFSSQGLVVTSDGNVGKSNSWRFPSSVGKDTFNETGVTSNLSSENTTLYKTVQTASGVERVPVQQTQVVEKSIEKKAEETAAMIFKLRQKRIDIITGDTDATYSGEAMGAALGEMTKLEQEYLSLFYGRSVKEQQRIYFEVIPKADAPKQFYIAFRFSDTQGLLHSTNVAGRPIVLELLEESEPISSNSIEEASAVGKNRIVYRQPIVMGVKIKDGQNTLLQNRLPIYQFGKIVSFPMDLKIK